MTLATTGEALLHLDNGNQLIGAVPELMRCNIKFEGKNNILYCEEGVKLADTNITFSGDNSLVYLGRSAREYKLRLTIFSNNVFHMGRSNYISQIMYVVLSEQKHIFFGDDCLISREIWMRNSDPHMIYSVDTKKRLNPTKSIFVGDHVWICQRCMFLKGARIDSGSLVGAMSVISGKPIPHNSIAAGNPIKTIRSNVFWDDACAHAWVNEHTACSQNYDTYVSVYKKGKDPNAWIYTYSPEESISWSEIDEALSNAKTAQAKLDYLLDLNSKRTKNRFVHSYTIEKPKKKTLFSALAKKRKK